MGGLHSGETGPSEMLMELVYRLATETSPLIKQIRDNVIVSVTPVAEPDGRDRNVDWFYQNRQSTARAPPQAQAAEGRDAAGAGGSRLQAIRPERQEAVAVVAAGLPCRTGASTSTTTTTATSTCRRCRCARIVDWYFTAHPPIMHDLHEAQPLMYTYSGGAAAEPEPRSDPVRRAAVVLELRAGADDEVGHAGRLHARVHGRLVARLSRLGRLQPQRHDADVRDAGRQRRPPGARPARALDAAGRGGAAGASRRRRREPPDAARRRRAGARARSGGGRGGRRRDAAAPAARVVSRHADSARRASHNFSRRNNTNYMETGVLSALQLTAMFPNLVVENFYRKTQNSIDAGKTEPPYGYVLPVQRDMTRVAATGQHPARRSGSRSARRTREIKVSDGDVPGRLVRHQARSAVRPAREEPARAAGTIPIPNLTHLRRQRLDDGAGDAAWT